MVPFDGKYLTSYVRAIVMFALSLSTCKIFTKVLKWKSVELENEGQGQGLRERDIRHSTGNIRFHIGEFFRIFATRQNNLYKETTDTQRETGVMTIDKICKADLPEPLWTKFGCELWISRQKYADARIT